MTRCGLELTFLTIHYIGIMYAYFAKKKLASFPLYTFFLYIFQISPTADAPADLDGDVGGEGANSDGGNDEADGDERTEESLAGSPVEVTGSEETSAFARSISPSARRERDATDGFHDRVSAIMTESQYSVNQLSRFIQAT